jgi:SAM-dependent methyltransferase
MVSSTYIGNELSLFSNAVRWKGYYSKQLGRFIRGRVLEVGAGIGETTSHLMKTGAASAWTCLEPDPVLSTCILEKVNNDSFTLNTEIITGTTADLPEDRKFDTILYIDVIEHIENDAEELSRAARHLEPGGHLIVLVPAHNFLFSPFDAAIGHYRRYNRKRLNEAKPAGLMRVYLRYLDSLGMLLSISNKLILRSSHPTRTQILFWDRFIVPLSRFTDLFSAYRLGKTLIGVWRA